MYPRCRKSGVQTNSLAARHEQSHNRRTERAQLLQHDGVQDAAVVKTQTFFVYEEALGWVGVFKYFGRLFSYDNNNDQAVQANLYKAQKLRVRISKVFWANNASPHVSGMFYRGTVQALLLFGSKTWTLTENWLKTTGQTPSHPLEAANNE